MPGAYGFELVGAPGPPSQLVKVGKDWPAMEIARVTAEAPDGPSWIDANRAEIRLLAGDRLLLEREPLRATFITASPLSDEALVHPYLAPAAAVAAYWLGRQAFHAGAFVLDDGVWAVMGEKELGKSSLLAWLALQGHAVLADDTVVLDGDLAFAGPRSIDLRQEPARELRAGEPMGTVGDRERWRLTLGEVAGAGRLRGWIFLAWSDEVEVVSLAAGSRLEQILQSRMVRGLAPADPTAMLELAALPAFRFGRPRQWPQLADAAGRLVDELSNR
ncbi:MAG: hypothetical protein QOE13_1816 [Gaiellaceae bacterium]|nr:hypothetical protein [Gaiellaceae bacterium]